MRVCYKYPGGKFKAMTFSFDDGVYQDDQLIDIFNRNGLVGTFNLNTGLKNFKSLETERLLKRYEGHEIACHGEFHATFDQIPRSELVREIIHDREKLEAITGRVITGLAYPNGSFSPVVMDVLRTCGIEYGRTTIPIKKVRYMPEDFLAWHPTCHYKTAEEYIPMFFEETRPLPLLFYIWGHSYELDKGDKDWKFMEDLAARLGGHDDVWYATNIEICRYQKAIRALQFSIDGRKVYNPSAETVWFQIGWEGVPAEYTVAPGETVVIKESEETY